MNKFLDLARASLFFTGFDFSARFVCRQNPYSFGIFGSFASFGVACADWLWGLFSADFVLKKWIDSQAFQEIFRFLLYLTSIFSAITAIFGMFLSSEGGYDLEQITFHQWAGLGVNWLYVLLLFAYEKAIWKVEIYFMACSLV